MRWQGPGKHVGLLYLGHSREQPLRREPGRGSDRARPLPGSLGAEPAFPRWVLLGTFFQLKARQSQ